MTHLEKIRKGFWLAQFFMVGMALFTLSQIGIFHPVPYHFDFSLEPDAFAPAIVAVGLMPLILAVAYYFVSRSPEKLNQPGVYVFLGCVILSMAAQTFLCVWPISS